MKTNTNLNIRFWSALTTTFFAIVYIIPQHFIGTDMQESKKDLMFILLPSMFLALSFFIMMLAVHYYAAEGKNMEPHLVAFCLGIVYFHWHSLLHCVNPNYARYVKK